MPIDLFDETTSSKYARMTTIDELPFYSRQTTATVTVVVVVLVVVAAASAAAADFL
jgi:hypothetical protein